MEIAAIQRKLLRKMRADVKRKRLSKLHAASKIPYSTLHDILKDKRGLRGNIRTWLRIDQYYSGLGK